MATLTVAGASTLDSDNVTLTADAMAIPSRVEPCGLTQMQAMRYGTVPIAHAVGGLVDTVIDGDTGFTFEAPTLAAFADAVARARDAYGTDAWAELMANGMARDWSWAGPAADYLELYRALI